MPAVLKLDVRWRFMRRCSYLQTYLALAQVTTENLHKEGWRTRQQLIEYYGAGSEGLVDELIAAKKAQGMFRRHPELPHRDDAMMFLCIIDMARSTVDQVNQVGTIMGHMEVSGDEAKAYAEVLPSMTTLQLPGLTAPAQLAAAPTAPAPAKAPAAEEKEGNKKEGNKKEGAAAKKRAKGSRERPAVEIEGDVCALDHARKWLTYLLPDIKALHGICVQLKAFRSQSQLIKSLTEAADSLEKAYEARPYVACCTCHMCFEQIHTRRLSKAIVQATCVLNKSTRNGSAKPLFNLYATQVIGGLVAQKCTVADSYQEIVQNATTTLAAVKEDVAIAQAVVRTKGPKKAKSKAGSSAGDAAALAELE